MSDKKSKPKFNREQFEMLKRCSENKNMTEWNQWRKRNPEDEILLEGANLDGACLMRANLKKVNLGGAKLRGAFLWEAELQQTNLRRSYLQGADLRRTNLQGTEFGGAKLQEADFSRAIVDGKTLIWDCKIDKKTKFEGVGLGNIRIYPNDRQLLEYNIRRMNWEGWYKKHKIRQVFIRGFWHLSNYGMSTSRIIIWFLVLALAFAIVYFFIPGLIHNLRITGHASSDFIRACYFSVVTMTTLGFGDMYADVNSIWGHILLSFQVFLGYVLLGSLVTRFAVLFTSGAPAGSFTPMDKETKQLLVETKKENKRHNRNV